MSPIPTTGKQTGFTMIEVLVTLSIVAILATIAMPGMKTFLSQNKKAAIAHELTAYLAIARSEAIKRKVTTYLCPSNAAGSDCIYSSNNTSLEHGWLIYSDCNGNDQYDAGVSCDLDNDGTNDFNELIKKRESPQANFDIEINIGNIGYTETGRVRNAGSIFFKKDGQNLKQFIISTTGRVRVDNTPD